MLTQRIASTLAVALLLAAPVTAASKDNEKGSGMVHCAMVFNLKGWSALYKTYKGEGTVTCDNGQSAKVALRVRGGGLTVGKTELTDATGTFSEVLDIDEIFGGYVAGSAHAGAVKGGEAAALTKGEVSLALAGSSRGFSLGVDISKLTIKRQ